MCGDMNFRVSQGGLIAAMFPFQGQQATTPSALVLSLKNPDTSDQTHATLSSSDIQTLHALRSVTRFTIRIEKYGDLMSTKDLEKSKPLYSFDLSPRYEEEVGRIEFKLPFRLDFGVSESGIVGRQATLLSPSDSMGRFNIVGKGVIGWN